MRLSLVVHVTGLVVRVFGLMFLAPLVVALIYREYVDAIGFGVVTVVTSRDRPSDAPGRRARRRRCR